MHIFFIKAICLAAGLEPGTFGFQAQVANL